MFAVLGVRKTNAAVVSALPRESGWRIYMAINDKPTCGASEFTTASRKPETRTKGSVKF